MARTDMNFAIDENEGYLLVDVLDIWCSFVTRFPTFVMITHMTPVETARM